MRPWESQPAQGVRQVTRVIFVRGTTEELRDARTHVAMAKPGGTEPEETQRLHEGEDAAIADAERGGALGVDDDGAGQCVEMVVADQTVVAQIFDAQEASVGGKADLPQGGQIA